MLRPKRMSKLFAIYPARYHNRVILELHERGIVELKETEDKRLKKIAQEEIEKLRDLAKRLSKLREFLGEISAKKMSIRNESFDYVIKRAEKILGRIEPITSELAERLERIESKKEEILNIIEKLKLLGEICPECDLSLLRSTEYFRAFFGRIPEEKLKSFGEDLRETFAGKIFILASKAGERRNVLVLVPSEESQKLLPIFYRHEFELIEIPPLEGKIDENLKRLEEELEKLNDEKEKLERTKQTLAKKSSPEICAVEEMVVNVLERAETNNLLGFTEATVVMEGWIPREKIRMLEKTLKTATDGICILREEESQEAPTELENPKIVKDFELLTEMYGVPRYDEVDPTPFLSLTFPIFFAITLSDAGYGLALAAFLLSGVWIAKIFPTNVRRMLAVCSLTGVIVGIFVGGCFGFGGGFWVNPIENPIPFLKLVVLIGILHILFGLGIAGVIKDLLRKDWRSLLFERISKVLIVFGFFGLAFCIIGVSFRDLGIAYTFPKIEMFEAFNPFATSPKPVGILRAIFYCGVLLGVVGALLKGETIRSKIGGAINTVYGITSFVADVASYTRLMALAIASGVIAFSINFIVSVFWGWMVTPFANSFPNILVAAISACLLAFIFFVAHCFNIFINTLGGFIHTMRLHFMEFFGKFYEGDGRKFSPFKAKRKYTKLKKREVNSKRRWDNSGK